MTSYYLSHLTHMAMGWMRLERYWGTRDRGKDKREKDIKEITTHPSFTQVAP